MKKMGFTCLKSNAGVFVKYDRNNYIIVVLYIDDMIFTSTDKAKVLKAKNLFIKC